MIKFVMITALAVLPAAATAFESKADCLRELSNVTGAAEAYSNSIDIRAKRAEQSPDAPNEDTEAYRAAIERMAESATEARDALLAICGRY